MRNGHAAAKIIQYDLPARDSVSGFVHHSFLCCQTFFGLLAEMSGSHLFMTAHKVTDKKNVIAY